MIYCAYDFINDRANELNFEEWEDLKLTIAFLAMRFAFYEAST